MIHFIFVIINHRGLPFRIQAMILRRFVRFRKIENGIRMTAVNGDLNAGPHFLRITFIIGYFYSVLMQIKIYDGTHGRDINAGIFISFFVWEVHTAVHREQIGLDLDRCEFGTICHLQNVGVTVNVTALGPKLDETRG